MAKRYYQNLNSDTIDLDGKILCRRRGGTYDFYKVIGKRGKKTLTVKEIPVVYDSNQGPWRCPKHWVLPSEAVSYTPVPAECWYMTHWVSLKYEDGSTYDDVIAKEPVRDMYLRAYKDIGEDKPHHYYLYCPETKDRYYLWEGKAMCGCL